MIPKVPSACSDGWQIDAVTSVFSKSSVFTRPTGERRFQKDPLWIAFSKSFVFGDRKHNLRVDTNSKRIKKMHFQKDPNTCGPGLIHHLSSEATPDLTNDADIIAPSFSIYFTERSWVLMIHFAVVPSHCQKCLAKCFQYVLSSEPRGKDWGDKSPQLFSEVNLRIRLQPSSKCLRKG